MRNQSGSHSPDVRDSVDSLIVHFPISHHSSLGRYPAVAILSLFPKIQNGIVINANTPMIMPKMPNGNAGPTLATQFPTKNVQAKETTARAMVVMTKQSAAMGW